GPEMREQLASSTMLVAVAKARKAKAERTKEVAALLKDIDAPGLQQVAERISAHAETRGASEAVASLTDTFAPAHGGDRIRAMVAATFEASAGSAEKEFDQVIAGAVGRARIESEVRARFNTSGKDMSPGEIPV